MKSFCFIILSFVWLVWSTCRILITLKHLGRFSFLLMKSGSLPEAVMFTHKRMVRRFLLWFLAWHFLILTVKVLFGRPSRSPVRWLHTPWFTDVLYLAAFFKNYIMKLFKTFNQSLVAKQFYILSFGAKFLNFFLNNGLLIGRFLCKVCVIYSQKVPTLECQEIWKVVFF